MMYHTHFHNKNRVVCVPCVPSCLPLFSNGTHLQALLHKTFSTNVYHVYHCAHARIREHLFICISNLFNSSLNTSLKKLPRVRNIILMVHMVHISLKALLYKRLLCVPFFCNSTQKTSMVNIAFQDVDFKIKNLCTIKFCSFSTMQETF